MKIHPILFCFIFSFVLSVKADFTDKLIVYKSYDEYKNASGISTSVNFKQKEAKGIPFAKIKFETEDLDNIWGVQDKDAVWIKNKKTFYLLREDSLGKYYDQFVDGSSTTTAVILGTTFGLAGALAAAALDDSDGQPEYEVHRYRFNEEVKAFQLHSFPNMPPARVYYYYSRYSKGESPIKVKLDNCEFTLTKKSYAFEDIASQPKFNKRGTCPDHDTKFQFDLEPSEYAVIMFKTTKKGALVYDKWNFNMVKEFMSKKSGYTKISGCQALPK
ncbi:MAG: hypothetical protein MRY83_16305 [Flavobacteriales bacterium]|nr:hypothetical protein [Flavobacteriales bacterium]